LRHRLARLQRQYAAELATRAAASGLSLPDFVAPNVAVTPPRRPATPPSFVVGATHHENARIARDHVAHMQRALCARLERARTAGAGRVAADDVSDASDASDDALLAAAAMVNLQVST
jgi:hypothetical protein